MLRLLDYKAIRQTEKASSDPMQGRGTACKGDQFRGYYYS